MVGVLLWGAGEPWPRHREGSGRGRGGAATAMAVADFVAIGIQ
jgi:hypothetical protein